MAGQVRILPAPVAATYALKGLPDHLIADVYSGEYPVDLASLRLYRLIIKATGKFLNGTVGEDYRVHDYVRDCDFTQTKYGFYHFARPGKISEQIAAFMGVWNAHRPTMPPIVDIEINPADYGIGHAEWRDQVYLLANSIAHQTGFTGQSGRKVLIYTNQFYFTYLLDANGNPPEWMDEFDWYVAWYPYYPDDFAWLPNSVLPKGVPEADIWQWGEDGRSQGYLINDFDLASARYIELLDFLASTTPPPSNGGSPMFAYSYIAPGFNMTIRTDHTTYAPSLATMPSLPMGKVAYGNEVWTAPADGDQVKAGDKWLHVLQADGKVVDGWIAVVHLGKVYATLTALASPPPPSSAAVPDYLLAHYPAGVLGPTEVFKKYNPE